MTSSFDCSYNLYPAESQISSFKPPLLRPQSPLSLESNIAFCYPEVNFEFDISARILVNTPELIRSLLNPKRDRPHQLWRGYGVGQSECRQTVPATDGHIWRSLISSIGPQFSKPSVHVHYTPVLQALHTNGSTISKPCKCRDFGLPRRRNFRRSGFRICWSCMRYHRGWNR